MVSTLTLNFFLSLIRGNFGDLSNPGLINFGKFVNVTYKVYELPIFLIMGAFGGLVGALFNYLNIKLTKLRNKYIKRRLAKVGETVLIASMSAVIGFLLSFYLNSDCQPIGRDLVSSYPVQLFCDDGQYNAMSGLFFQTPEKSVRSLFHDPPGSFNPVTLLVFCITYYLLACWTYGLAIPSGMFIPSLLIGAAWGRLAGIGINVLFPSLNIDPGKYALIGAASTLAGILRMTLSLTVIVTEATGDITLGLPIMFSMMAAKLVGDIFNEGLFDMHINLSGWPILEWE
jgi:chloride channel 7